MHYRNPSLWGGTAGFNSVYLNQNIIDAVQKDCKIVDAHSLEYFFFARQLVRHEFVHIKNKDTLKNLLGCCTFLVSLVALAPLKKELTKTLPNFAAWGVTGGCFAAACAMFFAFLARIERNAEKEAALASQCYQCIQSTPTTACSQNDFEAIRTLLNNKKCCLHAVVAN